MSKRTSRVPSSRVAVRVGIVMGSESDRPVMEEAVKVLADFGVGSELVVRSAHRTPEAAAAWAKSARGRGLRVIIAAAGGAAHLPGMVASKTLVPVLGVPIPATALNGIDALLSIVQMPAGVPVGTLAIGKPGAINAAILAAEIVGTHRPAVRETLRAYRAGRASDVRAQTLP